ncbi:MAG: serine hydrolase [Tepidisphaeraceae bacterium]
MSSSFLVPIVIALMSTISLAAAPPASQPFDEYILDFISRTDPQLQAGVEKIDEDLRTKYAMTREQTAVGVLDLRTQRLALINPDDMEYGASVPKIGILLAYFELRPWLVQDLDPAVRKELGEMIKISSNEMASKYSHEIGLKTIQAVLDKYKLYDPTHGGGIWVGKHYGKDKERYPDPVGRNSHAATVRQVMRYYLFLEQGKLVSPEVSKTMRQIFESPDIAHDQMKFVKGLAGREGLKIIRKSGSWENWLHDSAVVTGPDRHYILVALTEHPKGDDYLADLAPAVDDLLMKGTMKK